MHNLFGFLPCFSISMFLQYLWHSQVVGLCSWSEIWLLFVCTCAITFFMIWFVGSHTVHAYSVAGLHWMYTSMLLSLHFYAIFGVSMAKTECLYFVANWIIDMPIPKQVVTDCYVYVFFWFLPCLVYDL